MTSPASGLHPLSPPPSVDTRTSTIRVDREWSADHNQIFAAIIDAQGELDNPDRNRTAHIRPRDKQPYEYTYADLAGVRTVLRPVLRKHNIAYMQFPAVDGTRVTVETLILHKSGEWMIGRMTLNALSEDIKAIGSTITYNRRYQLCAIFGIVAEEDDDGTAASDDDWKDQQRIAAYASRDQATATARVGSDAASMFADMFRQFSAQRRIEDYRRIIKVANLWEVDKARSYNVYAQESVENAEHLTSVYRQLDDALKNPNGQPPPARKSVRLLKIEDFDPSDWQQIVAQAKLVGRDENQLRAYISTVEVSDDLSAAVKRVMDQIDAAVFDMEQKRKAQAEAEAYAAKTAALPPAKPASPTPTAPRPTAAPRQAAPLPSPQPHERQAAGLPYQATDDDLPDFDSLPPDRPAPRSAPTRGGRTRR